MPGADVQTRPRPVIVKFATAHARDVVIRARRRLRESGDGPTVYVNEDLTRRRAALAKKTRQLKKSRKINDCWTFNGKVVVKTIDGVVNEIRSDVDLKIHYQFDYFCSSRLRLISRKSKPTKYPLWHANSLMPSFL